MKPFLVAVLMGVGCLPLSAGPESVKVSFSMEKDRDKNEMADDKMGQGDKLEARYDFSFSLENLQNEAYSGFQAKVYVVAEPNDWDRNSELKVFKVLEASQIAVPAQSTIKADVGNVVLTSTHSAKGNTLWRSGYLLTGYLAEFSLDGKVLFTESKGGSAVKKAVQAHLKAESKKDR
ncbi:MAG: hypothetical protein SFU85_08205 [Candidatus Methylacidiphilales bacterium]|nr:hypothetical protein [Candidatus Methylacidiphilales bacterium]